MVNLISTLNDTSKTSEEKLDAVGAITDSFYFASMSENEAIHIINELIEQIIKQPDNSIKESILELMLDGYCSYNIEKKINLEPIVEQIHSFNDQCLSYILTLLGWSGKEEYRDLITSFFSNTRFKEDVEEALIELDHRVSLAKKFLNEK